MYFIFSYIHEVSHFVLFNYVSKKHIVLLLIIVNNSSIE